MTNNISENLTRFFILILIQIFLITGLPTYELLVPFVYVLFIIKLPFGISSFMILLLSFIMGLSIDAFTNTMGLHAASCVFAGFCRIIITTSKDEENTTPDINTLGFRWFATYTSIIVFAHHLILFNLEYFNWSDLYIATTKAVLSSIYTIFLIIISQYLFGNKK